MRLGAAKGWAPDLMLLSRCRCHARNIIRVRALMRRMLVRMPPGDAESRESALEDCKDPS